MEERTCIWDVDAIEFADLPTVGELVRAADAETLASIVVDELGSEDAGRSLAGEDRQRVCARVLEALRAMAALDAKPSKKRCLFPVRMFGADFETGALVQEVRCALVRRADFGRAAAALMDLNPVASRGEWGALQREARRSAGECDGARDGDRFACVRDIESWRTLLGSRIWLAGDLTRKERYQALADAVCAALRFAKSAEQSDRFVRALGKHAGRSSAKRRRVTEDRHTGARGGVPVGILLKRVGWGDYGLAGPIDDFEDEYDEGLMDLALSLNHNARIDLYRRIARLDRLLAAGYRRRACA